MPGARYPNYDERYEIKLRALNILEEMRGISPASRLAIQLWHANLFGLDGAVMRNGYERYLASESVIDKIQGASTMIDVKIKQAGPAGLTPQEISKAKNTFMAISLVCQKLERPVMGNQMRAIAENIEILISIHQRINEEFGHLWRDCY